MKRGEPMKRRTPLRRSRFSPRPSHGQQAHYDAMNELRPQLVKRSAGACKCGRNCMAMGAHAHHVIRRSQGGPDSLENLRWLSLACHFWVHTHVQEARDLGLLASPYQEVR